MSESNESSSAPDQDRPALGARGEQLAADHLVEQGWEILERNWTTSMGEVDIIARRFEERYGRSIEQVIFVEVKTRRARTMRDRPEASVTATKRKRLAKLARLWMKVNRPPRAEQPVSLRFDVIGVVIGQGVKLAHTASAFDEQGRLL